MKRMWITILAAAGLMPHTAIGAVSADSLRGEAGGVADNAVIEEIVVTARRRTETLLTVPVSVSAFTGETLNQKGVGIVQDLSYVTPSLSTSTVFSSNHVNFSMRAQAAENNTSGNVQPVEVYFAEVSQLSASLAQFYDLESVEVLRGPQGTLFGRASNGGAVLFNPKGPGETFEAHLSGQLGNLDNRELEGAISLPVSDTLGVRLAANIVRRDGYTEILNQDDYDLDAKHSNAFRVSVDYAPGNALTNKLVYDYVDIDQHQGSWNLLAARPGSLATAVNSPGFPGFEAFLSQNPDLAGIPGVAEGLQAYLEVSDNIGPRDLYIDTPSDLLIFKSEQHLVSNRTTLDFETLTFKNILGYQSQQQQVGYSADGSPFPILGGYQPLNLPLPDQQFVDRYRISDEMHILGTVFDARMDWLVGAYFEEMKDRDPGNQLIGLVLGTAVPVQTFAPTEFERTSKAVFAHQTFRMTNQWSFSAGIRRTWDDVESQQYLIQTPVTARGEPTAPSVCAGTTIEVDFDDPQCRGAASDQESSGTNWSASIDYTWDDGIAYLSARRGYKPAGVNTTSTIPQIREYDSEKIVEYELGLKVRRNIAGGQVGLNAALFQQQIDDAQRGAIVSNPATNRVEGVTLNADKAEVQGIEVELEVRPNEYVTLSAFGSYIDAEYKDFGIPIFETDPSGNLIQIGQDDVSGNPFPNVPEYSVGATAQMFLPVPASYGDVSVSATYYRQDKFFFDSNPEAEPEGVAPAYSIVNLNLDWNDLFGEPLDLRVFANNVGDKEYIRGGLSAQRQLGITHVTFGPPRTYGASITYRFGQSR